jgi:putative membrane protein
VPTVDRDASIRDHLANERTLLAWERTALALLGIGFVVDRFAFEGDEADAVGGTLLALAMVAAGGIAAVVGAYRFVRTQRQIDSATYQPSILSHLFLTGLVVAVAVGLALYLVAARSA